MMDKTRFLNLLETYGATIERWPEDVRVSGRLFLETADSEVLARLDDERAFDAFLAPACSATDVSMSLEEKLLSSAPLPSSASGRVRKGFSFPSWAAPRWVSALMVGGCLVGGAGAGYASTAVEVRNMAADDMMYFASTGSNDLIDTLEEEASE